MPLDEKARYTMRIDRDLLEKFGYIAEYEDIIIVKLGEAG